MTPEQSQRETRFDSKESDADPSVSIVVINHNYSQYVCEAIDSALHQTYRNIKVFVVDDGSTDESVEIISSRYGNEVTLVTQENMGIVGTRNKILSSIDADFLIQLDADDYLASDYVQEAVNLAKKEQAHIIYCQVQHFGRVNFASSYPDFNLEALKHENYIGAYAMISMMFLREKGIVYDTYLSGLGYEDWDFALGLCLAGAKAVLLDKPLYYYRKHESGLSRNDMQEADLLKLLLVRHHIWQKYNAQYPDEFRHFSAEIDLMLQVIRSLEEKNHLAAENQQLTAETQAMRQSHQWRMGGAILAPVRFARRLVRKSK